jgi:hypothetical protein
MLRKRLNLRLALGFLLTAGTVIPCGLCGTSRAAGGDLVVINNEALKDDSNGPANNLSAAAWGQDDWDVPKKADQQMEVQGQWALPNFDQWVLGNRTSGQIKSSLKVRLALQVQNVARACDLSAAQREKLELAGDCDLCRVLQTIEELRERFRQAPQDQESYSRLINDGSRMQMMLQTGIFGESSLYQKVVRQTLNGDQSARYERQERERRKFHYEAKIQQVMSNLESSISLTADQRQQLTKLLLDETEPPKKFGQYDFYVVFFQLGKLDDAKLKPILDESQRQSLRKAIDRYRGIERTLRAQGVLD